MAILNLGAGLAVFAGPLIVGLFFGVAGAEGVIWILAGLYLLSAVLTRFITLPHNRQPAAASTANIVNRPDADVLQVKRVES